MTSPPTGSREPRGARSARAKDALAAEPLPETEPERAALRDGLLRYGARDGAFRSRRLAVAELCSALTRTTEPGPAIVSWPGRRESGPTYEVRVPAAAVESAPPRTRGRRRLELRGAFLACGSLATPAHGYHLEFAPRDPGALPRLLALLRAEDLAPTVSPRGAAYFKGVEPIAAFFAAIGGAAAVFALEDERALRETKNRIRRLVNVEAANLDRATTAAAAQREAIGYLADAFGLRDLTPPLRELARLRLEHPSDSLVELGRRCDPPAAKSTVNARMTALLRRSARLAARAAATSTRREVVRVDGRPERESGGE